jgi:hypothetical protein
VSEQVAKSAAHRGAQITLLGPNGVPADRDWRAERRLFARLPSECRPRSATGVVT